MTIWIKDLRLNQWDKFETYTDLTVLISDLNKLKNTLDEDRYLVKYF